jgi:putative colanic acid biosynthesis UDP-glucose lipid carrier transferase
VSDFAQLRTEQPTCDWTAVGTCEAAPAPGAIPSAPLAVSRSKRALDLLIAVTAVLLFLPLLVLIAVAVRTETPGPALFRQKRTGLNGQVFTVFKFRTMTVTEDGAEIRQATRGDQRITPLGSVLRRLSLDELPQIFNVIRGEMSVIGPRPHAVAHDQAWAQIVPNYNRRFRARPGLTGHAAVCGHRGEVTDPRAIFARVEADNDYIDNWSLMMDLKIVWRTIPLVFSDTNAY